MPQSVCQDPHTPSSSHSNSSQRCISGIALACLSFFCGCIQARSFLSGGMQVFHSGSMHILRPRIVTLFWSFGICSWGRRRHDRESCFCVSGLLTSWLSCRTMGLKGIIRMGGPMLQSSSSRSGDLLYSPSICPSCWLHSPLFLQGRLPLKC